MKKISKAIGIILVSGLLLSVNKPKNEDAPCLPFELTVSTPDSINYSYLRIPCIYEQGWDKLPEVKFWQNVIHTDQDSFIANVYETREILEKLPRTMIDSLDKNQLDNLRKRLAFKYNLDSNTRILFTSGKSWFYSYTGIKQQMKQAIDIFENQNVDPFYAQMVLLIESPGSGNDYSYSGAYGQFQLMPSVARQYGLTVNKYYDERADFGRSAYASARLFKEICIPYAKRWLENRGFDYKETDFWFKLIVLHIYNAGASNVKPAIDALPPHVNGQELIKALWHTSAGRFRNEAQNYSQIAIACYLKYEKEMNNSDILKIRDIKL